MVVSLTRFFMELDPNPSPTCALCCRYCRQHNTTHIDYMLAQRSTDYIQTDNLGLIYSTITKIRGGANLFETWFHPTK